MQVSVDYVRRLLPEPAMEANPSPRIGEPLAHSEAQKPNAGRRQLARPVASWAGERDHGHPPATFDTPFGQQDHLPLGAADAFKAGDDEGNVVHGSFSWRVASISFS